LKETTLTKQLLIYQSAAPLSASRHGNVSLEANDDYTFSAGVNAVPLMAVELVRAATEYAIVFTAAGDDVVPAAVLGIKGEQNLYLTEDAHWKAKYIPAFIRRYPFVFAASEDKKTLTLCIDDAHPGVNREGKGQKLFGDDAKPTEYTQNVLKFLQDYQLQFERTKLFGKHLKELDLLVPMQATVTTPKGEPLSLGSFMAVSREKLRALDGEKLASLAKTDELELVYLHLYSMRNFNEVKDRLVGAMAQAAPEPEAAATAS
jgi:hypothetical protein